MIIAVTGTPGTGKDTVSKLLAQQLGFKLVDLNKLAKEKILFKGHDNKRKCDIVDIKKLNNAVKSMRGDLVIQSHYSHLLDCDLVVVLRTELKQLRKRLEKRGWSQEKIKENLEAEIFEVCKQEALEKTKKVFEFDTTNKKPQKTIDDILDIVYMEMEIKQNLKLPKKLFAHFKKPYGRVFASVKEFSKSGLKPAAVGLMISVGDMTSYTLTQAGVKPDIIIVDNKVNRKPFKEKITFHGKVLNVRNTAGKISKDMWQTIKQALASKGKVKISVLGEEDLAVLPAVIMAPLGSVVLYGQPKLNAHIGHGLVAIYVDLNKKKDAFKLLRKMITMQRLL